MKSLISVIVSFSFIISGISQHTISLEGESPAASIQDVAWIAGHWQGEAFGGTVEEIWAEPMGGAMMGSFRQVSNGEVGFYEMCIIREINETLILQIKHFHGDLKGWEEKDETVDFPLVKIEEGKAYFDDFTFEKVSDDELTLYVVISEDGDSKKEIPFKYRRKK